MILFPYLASVDPYSPHNPSRRAAQADCDKQGQSLSCLASLAHSEGTLGQGDSLQEHCGVFHHNFCNLSE